MRGTRGVDLQSCELKSPFDAYSLGSLILGSSESDRKPVALTHIFKQYLAY
jgi:hypothetical protein